MIFFVGHGEQAPKKRFARISTFFSDATICFVNCPKLYIPNHHILYRSCLDLLVSRPIFCIVEPPNSHTT
jgi:hypothetical protein